MAINPNALLNNFIHSGGRLISLRRRRDIEHDARIWSQDCKNERVLAADKISESANLLVTKDKYATYSEAPETAQNYRTNDHNNNQIISSSRFPKVSPTNRHSIDHKHNDLDPMHQKI